MGGGGRRWPKSDERGHRELHARPRPFTVGQLKKGIAAQYCCNKSLLMIRFFYSWTVDVLVASAGGVAWLLKVYAVPAILVGNMFHHVAETHGVHHIVFPSSAHYHAEEAATKAIEPILGVLSMQRYCHS